MSGTEAWEEQAGAQTTGGDKLCLMSSLEMGSSTEMSPKSHILPLVLLCHPHGHNRVAIAPSIMFSHNDIPNRTEGGMSQRIFSLMNFSLFWGRVDHLFQKPLRRFSFAFHCLKVGPVPTPTPMEMKENRISVAAMSQRSLWSWAHCHT